MPTYQRKQAPAFEALQFTSDIAEEIREGFEHEGLTYSEHTGYAYHDARITFGDYMVGRDVVPRETFESQYEEVIAAEPTRSIAAQALEGAEVTGQYGQRAVVTTDSRPVPAHKARKRTEPSA